MKMFGPSRVHYNVARMAARVVAAAAVLLCYYAYKLLLSLVRDKIAAGISIRLIYVVRYICSERRCMCLIVKRSHMSGV